MHTYIISFTSYWMSPMATIAVNCDTVEEARHLFCAKLKSGERCDDPHQIWDIWHACAEHDRGSQRRTQ